MRSRATRSIAGAACALAIVGSASVAWSWGNSVLFSATVWSHRFSEVRVEAADCSVKVSVTYDAPASAYKSRLASMNHYRFKARARFASGVKAAGPVFSSSKPGAQSHTFSFDTSGEGCWAREKQALVAMDVEGCRGEGCTVEPFK